VFKLPKGSTAQTQLPFTGLNMPEGVAVDTASNVYVADYGNYRVLKLAAGQPHGRISYAPFSGSRCSFQTWS
jgi:DNA-binding beta-propeller fold protein YncE